MFIKAVRIKAGVNLDTSCKANPGGITQFYPTILEAWWGIDLVHPIYW